MAAERFADQGISHTDIEDAYWAHLVEGIEVVRARRAAGQEPVQPGDPEWWARIDASPASTTDTAPPAEPPSGPQTAIDVRKVAAEVDRGVTSADLEDAYWSELFRSVEVVRGRRAAGEDPYPPEVDRQEWAVIVENC